jgi:transmembrane sensor
MKNIPDEILALYLTGEISETQRQEVETWLAEDPKNVEELEKLRQLWKEPTILYAHKHTFDSVKAFEKLDTKIQNTSKPQMPIHAEGRKKIWKWALGIAASIILLISITEIYKQEPNTGSFKQEITLQVQKSIITLEDGTKIWLNNNTKLRYPENFEGDIREVYLEGEAFFDVAHNPKKPFIIHTNKADIQVLGTSFLVKSEEEATQTTVVSGKVSVKTQDKSEEVLLTPNQKATASTKGIEKTQVEKAAIFWQKEVLLMKNNSIQEVIEKLEKYYRVDINVQNPSIYNCNLTGDFNNLNLEESLQLIQIAIGIEYKIDKQTVQLIGKGCK